MRGGGCTSIYRLMSYLFRSLLNFFPEIALWFQLKQSAVIAYLHILSKLQINDVFRLNVVVFLPESRLPRQFLNIC